MILIHQRSSRKINKMEFNRTMGQTTPQEGGTMAVPMKGRKTALMGVSLWKGLWGSDTSQDECEFTERRGKSPLEGNTRLQLQREGLGLPFCDLHKLQRFKQMPARRGEVPGNRT